jgi:hypothetical protein
MRGIAFMWIAAIIGALVGFVAGRASKRQDLHLEDALYDIPPDETPVLQAMSAWDATRDDELRERAFRPHAHQAGTFAGPTLIAATQMPAHAKVSDPLEMQGFARFTIAMISED